MRVFSIIVVDPPVTVTDAFVPLSVLSAADSFLVTVHSPSTDPSVHVLVLHNCTPNVSSLLSLSVRADSSNRMRPDLSAFTCCPAAVVFEEGDSPTPSRAPFGGLALYSGKSTPRTFQMWLNV